MSHIIPNQYIVVFKQDIPRSRCQEHCARTSELHTQRVGIRSADGNDTQGILHHYNFPTWNGYAVSCDEDLKNEVEGMDEVDFIEPDYRVTTQDIVKQEDVPSWGLARISHRAKLSAETRTTYEYDDTAGEGTRAYIIDTGIVADHEDFEGRATFGYNAVPGSSDTDKNGHGTHVAGTIGGKKYGVAKKATLIGVKVLGDDGSGTNSTVIAGLQWAAEHAQNDGVINKSVANMSLGGSSSKALNSAVAAVVNMGMTICAAAGNESKDASTSSPASEPSVVTVGAIDDQDAIASFSNFGKLVDIFAPGVKITSSWIDESGSDGKNLTNTISGTSMAAPHVAGLACYLIAKDKLSGSEAVTNKLRELAHRGQVSFADPKKDSPNYLAYNGVEVSN